MPQSGIFGVGGVKMVEGDDKIRAKKCLAEIREILMQYDCILVPEMRLLPGAVEGNVKIVPKPRVKNEPS